MYICKILRQSHITPLSNYRLVLTLSKFSLLDIDVFCLGDRPRRLWFMSKKSFETNKLLYCKYIAVTVKLKLKKTLTGKWVLQMINHSLRKQWNKRSILFNTSVLFGRPLASFTNNIYIDRSDKDNTKTLWVQGCVTSVIWYASCTKAKVKHLCKLFCFLKITSFHIPHNDFKTLTLLSKLQREKWQERLSQILDLLLFSDAFSLHND